MLTKVTKLPRTVRDPRGAVPEDECAVPGAALSPAGVAEFSEAAEPEASVRRLAALCQHLSPTDRSQRDDRIAALQKAIADGSYRISAADIAEKLIEHMMINRPPRS